MKIHYKYLLLVAWIGLIFFLSAEGSDDSQARSGIIVGILKDSFSVDLADSFLSFLTRKAAHIIAYFILGILIYSIIKAYELATKRAVIFSIIFAMFYAVFDEIHQLFVPGRSGEIRDIFIDTIAASAGIGAHYMRDRIPHNSKNSKDRI